MSRKYQFQKGILGVMFCLALLLVCVPVAAYAQEEESTVTTEFQTIIPDALLPDNDELFGGYAELNIFGDGSMASTYATLSGDRLGTEEKVVYDALKSKISTVAANGGSTEFEVDVTDKGITYTDGSINIDINRVIDALLTDCPYELYWFDKTAGVETSVSYSGTEVLKLVFKFTVSSAYKGTSVYTVSNTHVGTANTAKTNAENVITEAKKETGVYNQLLYCLDYIKTNVAYGNTSSTDNNTWQMIWVFDGKADTNVVCEGYAKAFKYLCDGIGVDCYTVTGTMSGGTGAGLHMWNIVVLNGNSYLVDPTNCDGDGTTNSIGYPDKLFLKKPTSVGGTSENPTYTYTFDSANSCTFVYDTDTIELLGSKILTLATSDYALCTGHTGGTATCVAKAICTTCGSEYGDVAADNHGAINTATGLCSNGCGTNLAVVQITAADGTSAYYSTFADALTNWTDSTTLTLLSDVSHEAGISLSSTAGTNKVLDLNGMDLTLANKMNVCDGVELTITDSSADGAGTIEKKGEDDCVVVSGTLNFSNGKIVCGLRSVGIQVWGADAELNITGGTIMATGGEGNISPCVNTVEGKVVVSGSPKLITGDEAVQFAFSGGSVTIVTDAAVANGWSVWNNGISEGVVTGTNLILPDGMVLMNAASAGTYMEKIESSGIGYIVTHTHTLDYTNNGDGTHDATCSCGYVKVDNEAHNVDATYTLTADGTRHIATWSCCGATVTEDHDSYIYSANGNVISKNCDKCNTAVGTITIAAENYSYDGTAHEATVTKTGIPENETVTVAYYKGDTLLDSAPVNAGTYTVKATCGGATASVALTIAPKPVTVTADNTGKTYGEEDTALTYNVPSGLVLSDTLTGELTREEGEDVGTYAIKQGTLTNENNPNYNINFVNGTFTINKATAPAVSEPVAGRITYGQQLSASTLSSGWTWANGNVIPMVTNNGYEAVLTVDDVNYDYTGVSGYNAATHTVSRTISVDVLKAPLTVTANSYTIRLGASLPDPLEYTVAGLQGTTDTITNIGANVTISYSSTATSSALGTYPIEVKGEEETANYVITYIDGVLYVVEKLIPTITASDITLTYGDINKKVDATSNGDGAITYTVATGTDVISVDTNGNITVLKAGTATVTINAAETADYAAVAKTVTVAVNKAENAPNKPSATMNVPYDTETVGEVTLPTDWAWAEADSAEALVAGATVTAMAIYNGADKGNYETETVSVAITRSACTHSYTSEVTKQPTVDAEGERTYTCSTCGYSYTEAIDKLEPTPTPTPGGNAGGGYYPPYYPSYPSYPNYPTATPVPTVAPTATPTPVPTEAPAPTTAPTAAPSATPAPTTVPGTVTVPTSGETVVNENGEEVTSIVQEPGTTTKLSIPGLTDVKPEEGEEAAPVVWESSNPDVAEVDENGNITMKEPGLAEIVVTVGEGEETKTETIVVLVEEPRTYVNPLEEAFKDVRLGTSWADIPLIRYQKLGETVDINFWGVKNWKLDNYEYIWKSSDESLATVDNKGRVTALKPGTFDLTLGLKNKTTGNFLNVQSVEIVIPGNYDDKILLGTSRNNTFDSIVLKLNERIDINFYGVKNWKKDDYEYYWSSSEPSVVWVDNLGRLIPVNPGKAEIFLVLVEKKTGAPRYVVPMEVTVPEK